MVLQESQNRGLKPCHQKVGLLEGGDSGETPLLGGNQRSGKNKQLVSVASWFPRRRPRNRFACSSRETQPARLAWAGAPQR
jgi:hypothetical protein